MDDRGRSVALTAVLDQVRAELTSMNVQMFTSAELSDLIISSASKLAGMALTGTLDYDRDTRERIGESMLWLAYSTRESVKKARKRATGKES